MKWRLPLGNNLHVETNSLVSAVRSWFLIRRVEREKPFVAILRLLNRTEMPRAEKIELLGHLMKLAGR